MLPRDMLRDRHERLKLDFSRLWEEGQWVSWGHEENFSDVSFRDVPSETIWTPQGNWKETLEGWDCVLPALGTLQGLTGGAPVLEEFDLFLFPSERSSWECSHWSAEVRWLMLLPFWWHQEVTDSLTLLYLSERFGVATLSQRLLEQI